MEAVFRPEVIRIFFRWIPANFLCFLVGAGRKASEKSEKVPAGILLPKFIGNPFDPAVSHRTSLILDGEFSIWIH
jgi:hypothetical protein